MVRTIRRGRSNPGSNPSLDRILFCTVDGKSPSRRNNRITGNNSDNETTVEENSARKGGFDIGTDRRVVRTLRCGLSIPGSNPCLTIILHC